MKNNKIIFLRHAETEKDPSVNAAMWVLSKTGEDQSEKTALLEIMQNIDLIFVSEEIKTFLTAIPISKKANIPINKSSYFNEVKRGDKFLTKENFEIEKTEQLKNLNYKAFNGETGFQALERFQKGISDILENNQNKTILVVTHGTILNIYFAHILNKKSELMDRWNKTNFCSYGIIENGKVVKDII